jgi:hypothetical protein
MSIESIRAREQAATPGPWTGYAVGSEGAHVTETKPSGRPNRLGRIARLYDQPVKQATADADFIAHARQDIPAPLRVAEAAQSVAPFLVAMHKALGDLYVNPRVIGDAERLAAALAGLEALP